MVIVEALSGPVNMAIASYGNYLNKEAGLTVSRHNVAQQQFQVPHRSTKLFLASSLWSILVLAKWPLLLVPLLPVVLEMFFNILINVYVITDVNMPAITFQVWE